MPQPPAAVHLVAIAATFSSTLHDAGIFELCEDALHRAFGDADFGGDVPDARRRVPCDANQHVRVVAGEQVSQGDALAWLVPDTRDRAVALNVDGNDAALIQSGDRVRLQFEGWPAVQFAGWPSVAVGTFGGKVAFVDAADDGRGDFRVVVVPDDHEEPWPSPRYLRQGVRAKGWFLLRRVTVGYELWRQLNGFPPALGEKSPTQASR